MTLPAFSCSEKIPTGENSTAVVTDDNGNSASQADGNAEVSNADSKSENSAAEDSNTVTDPEGGNNIKLSFDQPETIEDDIPAVSTIRGDDGNVYVEKTDINGAVVTEENGDAKTEIYTGVTASYSDNSYVAASKVYQAYWMDISKRQDFVFDGNLLELEVKIADDAKDGVYPVEVYYSDFSNYSANTDENAKAMKDVAFRAGYVCINSEEPAQEALGTKMTLTPETISAKPGETVRMNIRIDNNPGIVAFVIRMRYDSNMMTVVKAAAGSDLGARAKLTTNTLDDEDNSEAAE
jgi:hypothetical protein